MRKIFALLMIAASVFSVFGGPRQEKDAGSSLRTISIIVPSMGPSPRGRPEVVAEINKITESLGVKIEMTIIEVGAWANTVPVMMASREKIDLQLTVPLPSTSFNGLASQNHLMDITNHLNNYGQDLVKTVQNVMPAFLDGTKINGRIYGVPGLYSKVNSYFYLARADLLDKYNIDIYAMKNLDDIEAALKKVQAGEPSLSPLLSGIDGTVMTYNYPARSFSEQINTDNLADGVSYTFSNNPFRVVNYYKTEEFKNMVYKMRDWYTKGYVYKDAPINKEMPEELLKSNRGFSLFQDSEIGIEAAKTAQTGKQLRAVKIHDNNVGTELMRKFVWIVPSYSRDGEAAVKFLNALYSRPELSRLITWGIEGRDYIVKADGTAAYPPGVTAQTAPFHQMDFLGGNQYLVPPWEGNSPDLRTTALRENQNAPLSPILGFSYDPTPVSLEITAVANVVAQYSPGLRSGSVDPGENLPKFIKALDDAGAQKMVDEMQRQLDAWRAANNK